MGKNTGKNQLQKIKAINLRGLQRIVICRQAHQDLKDLQRYWSFLRLVNFVICSQFVTEFAQWHGVSLGYCWAGINENLPGYL